MFEKFGIKDVFCNIWKYRYRIVVFILIGAVLGSFYGIYKCKNNINNQDIDIASLPIKYESATYYLSDDSIKDEKTQEKYLQDVKNYCALLQSDACSSYVYNRLLNEYGKEQLKEKILFKKTNPTQKEISIDFLKEKVKIQQLGDSSVFSIVVATFSEEVSATILEGYIEYINILENTDKISPVKAELVKTVKEDVWNTKSVTTMATNNGGINKKVVIKWGLVLAIVFFAISLIVLFFITLFAPVLNRKSDFEHYGIKVIGEIKYANKYMGGTKNE